MSPSAFRKQVARAIQAPLPARKRRVAQSCLAPQLSYGRHFGPPQHDARQAAILVALYERDGCWRTTLTRRPVSMKNHGGQICFPGGVLDGGETLWECAQREWAEELGGEHREWRLAGELAQVYVFASNHLIQPFVAVTEPPDYAINAAEVAEVMETPLHVFSDTPRTRQRLERWGTHFDAPCFEWGDDKIWGATAVVIAELSLRLRDVLSR